MSWDEIVSALSMLWARQKPELLQLLQPGLNKALRLALVGTVLMAVLLAALLAVRLVKKQKKGLAALGICLGLCVGAGAALYLPRPVLAAGAAGGTGVSVSVLSAQDAFIFAPSTQAQANAEANKAQSEQAAMENEAGTAQTQPAAQMGQVPAEAPFCRHCAAPRARPHCAKTCRMHLGSRRFTSPCAQAMRRR